jgi:hypothetical protein
LLEAAGQALVPQAPELHGEALEDVLDEAPDDLSPAPELDLVLL